jgi:lipid-A-disaccharide synthase
MKQRTLRIFLSAGEASGDHYGADLIGELERQIAHRDAGKEAAAREASEVTQVETPHGAKTDIVWTGLGGRAMEAAGQQRVVRTEDVAVMGITEILRHVPRIYAAYRRLVASIRRDRPDLAILIDFPDVNFRLAKHLHRAGVPVVWFVSPQLWAWKRRRLRWVQQRVNRMLVIFPFEAEFYRNRGVDAEFVGHPLAALPRPVVTREAFAAQHRLDPALPWVALLPGSRRKEVRANLPAMLVAAGLLRRQGSAAQFVLPVASTLDTGWLQEQIDAEPTNGKLTSNPTPLITLVDDHRAALHHARAAAVASGTATMQAAVLGTPFVVVYRVSRLTFELAKRLVRYPAEIPAPADALGNLPIAMPNLIAGRRIVPELLNDRFTPEALAAELTTLLGDTPMRAAQLADLNDLKSRLVVEGAASPIQQAIQRILPLLRTSN